MKINHKAPWGRPLISKGSRLSKYSAFVLLLFLAHTGDAEERITEYSSHAFSGRSIVFTSVSGHRLRITPYGEFIVRLQAVRKGEDYYPDDRYEMVESHEWPGNLRVKQRDDLFEVSSVSGNGFVVNVRMNPMRCSFCMQGDGKPVLSEGAGICWKGSRISETFVYDRNEHFTGLGHSYFGRADRLDLRGTNVERNYGRQHGDQAPLIVPFYLSGNGYGIFLNSTFPNSFGFGKDGVYGFSIEGGRMDFFFICGPDFPSILERYTALTGRPRLPPLAMFGLALSDKGNDHTSRFPSDERWWKQKVTDHRQLGFPIDHLINDNRWRAGGGQRCESYFAWDRGRFPDPAEYERWLGSHALVTTIDFNRCIASRSEGWLTSYNIPHAENIEFGESAPDFSRKEVRDWFWGLFWSKSLDTALQYPGDALWIDEFDELGNAPSQMILGNGRTWAEMKNYWFFLIAKALVQEGWDRCSGRRPFVWVRGMTAGAQRFATLWSGDIRPTFDEMKSQIRGMQLAGLSGFPFWGDDAGGFYDWQEMKGPDEKLYQKWAMALGSFTPFWKPHGMGESRWPADRSAESQAAARIFTGLRYALLPYTYSYAHQAYATGMPIARAMVIEYQTEPRAWEADLQYLWGKEFLVVPSCTSADSITAWIPPGNWYDYWTDRKIIGGRVIGKAVPAGGLGLFVRSGAIVPMAPPALSTAFLRMDSLTIQVYSGNDGLFDYYEDDGKTEQFRTNGENRVTHLSYRQTDTTLRIDPAAGQFAGAPSDRSYCIIFHGLQRPLPIIIRRKSGATKPEAGYTHEPAQGIFWYAARRCLTVQTPPFSVTDKITIGPP